MSLLQQFAEGEYVEQAAPAVAQAALNRLHHGGAVRDFFPDHVDDCTVVRCECGHTIRVTREIWAEMLSAEVVRIARQGGGTLIGMLAMADAAAFVREHPSGLTPDQLKDDAFKAVEDRDHVRAERRIAELAAPRVCWQCGHPVEAHTVEDRGCTDPSCSCAQVPEA